MSFYRRAKSAFNALRSAIPRTPFHESAPRISGNPSIYSSNNAARVSGISRVCLFSSQIGPKGDYPNPFLGGARRWYYVPRRRQLQHFKPPPETGRWFLITAVIVVVVGSGVLTAVYFRCLETVPYTCRKHVVLFSRSEERRMGESEFNDVKSEFKGKILPATHPDSVRVMLILNDIIKGLERGLSHAHVWSNPGYAVEETEGDLIDDDDKRSTSETTAAAAASTESSPEEWFTDEEILDDEWVYQSRKKAQENGSRPTAHHLEGWKWEVLVVNKPDVNAVCLPGGKIVVSSGLFKHFTTDAEIATIIGHEVAHAVARHVTEERTKNLWFDILQLILSNFIMPPVVDAVSTLLLRHPFSRMMEMEADYIGLMLLASAGYDPRIAPKVYEKLGKVSRDEMLKDYLSTHPSGKKRAQLLAQAKVMEEALTLYWGARAGRGTEGFLLGIGDTIL